MHLEVDHNRVKRALGPIQPSSSKAPGIDQLNFLALRLLWGWDAAHIVALVRQCFRLGLHPQAWKTAKGILLRKPNKPDYSVVKVYRVISLLNCIGKVVEKMAAKAISNYCEATGVLHPGQMGSRKQRSAIDAVACLVQEVHRAWGQKQLVGALFMDVKGAFDHVDVARLVKRMLDLGLDTNLCK
jgi:hypothetical protein